jgi:hypothetical protein
MSNPTVTQPYAIGTQVIIVRPMRVMHDSTAPLIFGKIGAKLEPYQGEPRYTLAGNDQLAYFHREICTTRREAIGKIGDIQRAEEKRVKNAIACANRAIDEFIPQPE